MSVVRDRRPPLATSVSAPDVFCRPMDPAPAPLVYINGWHGIGKETVAECLTLLLGKDKSLLIDVRSVGRETVPNHNCCGGGNRVSKHKHHHRHEHNPLLTPEHPRYFSFDLDSDAQHSSPLPSPSFSSPSFSAAFSPPTSRSASFSSDSTTATTISTSSTSPATTATTTTVKTTTNTTTTTTTSTTTSTTSPTTPYPPLPAVPIPTPCSSENLTALLTHPRNTPRLAVLPACCPDTPAGHATLRIFEAAAARAGRLFVGVVLRCEEGVYLRRRGGRAHTRFVGRRVRVESVGSLDSVLLGGSACSSAAGSAAGSSGLDGLGVGVGVGVGGGWRGVGEGLFGAGGGGQGKEGRGMLMSLPGPGSEAEVGTASGGRMGAGVCCTQGQGQSQSLDLGLARPVKAGLTVDVTCVPAFEAALQIVEFVKGLVAERDAELCSNGGSAATTPAVESEKKLEASGLAEGK